MAIWIRRVQIFFVCVIAISAQRMASQLDRQTQDVYQRSAQRQSDALKAEREDPRWGSHDHEVREAAIYDKFARFGEISREETDTLNRLCSDQASKLRFGSMLIIGGAFVLMCGYDLWQWRLRRRDQERRQSRQPAGAN